LLKKNKSFVERSQKHRDLIKNFKKLSKNKGLAIKKCFAKKQRFSQEEIKAFA